MYKLIYKTKCLTLIDCCIDYIRELTVVLF